MKILLIASNLSGGGTSPYCGPRSSYENIKSSLLKYAKNHIIKFVEPNDPKPSVNEANSYDIVHVLNDADYLIENHKSITTKMIIGPNVAGETLQYQKKYDNILRLAWDIKDNFKVKIARKGMNTEKWYEKDKTKIPELDFFIPSKSFYYPEYHCLALEIINCHKKKGLRCEYLEQLYKPYHTPEVYREFIDKCKFMVFPTPGEHFAAAMLECFSTDTPIVHYSINFPSPEAGYLCENFNLNSFSEGIKHMMDNYKSYSPRKFVIENHSLEHFFKSYLDILQEFLDDKYTAKNDL